jgi:chromosome segregation ATPase
MSNTAMTPDQFFDELDKLFGTDDGYENHLKRIKGLKEENAELKELSDGIMNEEGTQHILGINPYEKFCQAMCELDFDESLICELKKERAELKENIELLNKQLELQEKKSELLRDKHQKSIDIFKEEIEKGTRASKDAVKFMKENEKLLGVIDSVKAHLEDDEHVVISTPLKYAPIVNAIERLKKENEQLKKELDLYKEAESLIQPFENPQALSVKIKELKLNYQDLQDKVEELEESDDEVSLFNDIEKIEELEASLKSTENYWKSKYENEESTNKMLNDAIINHTEILDELRTYLSNFEGDVLEVFDKIVNSTD